MSKPRSVPVNGSENEHQVSKAKAGHSGGQEPLSGSKKTKNENHSRHNNGEG